MAQVSYGTITITDITDIDNIQNYYLATSASSGVTTSTSGWTTGIQSMTSTNQYLWNYEQILGTGGVVINTTTPVIIGRYGQNGQPGVSITSIDEYYKANNSSTTKPTSWNAVNVIDKPTASNKYLWNYQVIHYSNNTTEGSASEARIIGVYGDKGEKGDDGISPTVSKSGSTVTITDAEGNIVTVSDGTNGTSYYTHIRYATSSAGANMTSTPTSSTIYIGIYSGTSATAPTTANSYTWSKYMGTNGTNGISVTKVTPIYYLKTSSGSVPTAPSSGTVITSTSTGTGVWTTAIPTYVNGGTYYTSTQTYLSGGTSPVSSTAVIDQALTTANSNAYGAYNVATGINQHFWSIESDYATGIPAGSYITDTIIDTFKSNKTGGNLLTRSDGIWIRNGIQTLASLTGSALQFYNPSDSNHPLQLSIGANGTLQSGNYVYTSGTYSDSGTKIDLTNGSIYTPGFRTDGSNTYIRGEINALSGKIGNNSTNYWTIGNNFNYDQTASAALISHGTAFIQLDTSNTWRLSTDRIHTAWNGTDGSAALMFPKDGNTYWDWGIHSPHKTGNTWKDKFVYARKYTNTTEDDFTNRDNLSNDIDDDVGIWKYQFYIDRNGSIYARNFYLLNEDGTPGSNIGGQDAVYLLKTGGTITGNLTVNGTITGNLTGTASNAAKVNNLTVQTAVPANAVFTDKNVRSTQNNTAKIWLVGTPDGGDRTGEVNYDSNVYLTTTAGTLHATTFEGNLSGTATKANQDGDGNVIKTTYLKLSGGDVTGPVTFGSSVSADELTAGDLVVNGNGSFTNNLQVNTINGVTVGSSPKFTDTVTTVTTSGNGNAVTAITASNGKLTVTKGTTFLTSYTETDPIFVASAAHGITSTDISNWNSKTSNTGTVTSVRVQASSPLTSTTSTASSTTLDTTIKFANQNKNLVLAGPSSGNAAAPTFRSLVADDIPGLAWSKITSGKPTTLSGYGITDAAGSNAIVGLSASSNSAGVTTFTATRASGTDPLSFEVSIVASAATGASALKDSNGLISKGSATKPVYFSNGVPAEANTYAGGTAVTLNGSGKGASTASFYAPTSGGTANQVLISKGTAAPEWTNQSNLSVGSATTASKLSHTTLNNTTLHNTAGTFAFSGSGLPWDGSDWVGLQVGDNVDKFQISANGNTLVFRQNDSGGTNTSWSDWVTMLTSGNYTNYTVTKTGSGASGTWGISITGNAATATKATQDGDGYVIKDTYVKKAGDTMTGILTLYRESTTANNYPAGISFSVKDTTTGQSYTSAHIYAYQDHASSSYGTNMVICSGGGMFLGSGESPANHYSAKGASYNGEDTFITADGTMYIQSSGNTIANRLGFYISTAHDIVPCKADVATNNVGSIGTSSYKWASIYATTFYGALSGNASTASMIEGFASNGTGIGWGNQTGTPIRVFNDSTGGSMGWRRDNPVSGQVSQVIDGTIYIKEGQINIGDAIKTITRSGTTFTYTTLWGNTGTFTQQDNDTKNTAGSTDTSSEIYLIGATSQATNPQTYSHDTARVRANGNFVGSGYEMAINTAMGTTKAVMKYDLTLEAIVFSFA